MQAQGCVRARIHEAILPSIALAVWQVSRTTFTVQATVGSLLVQIAGGLNGLDIRLGQLQLEGMLRQQKVFRDLLQARDTFLLKSLQKWTSARQAR